MAKRMPRIPQRVPAPPKPINRFNRNHAFLSNFYPVEIHYDGIVYPSLEHAYQAQKTTDKTTQFAISQARTPAEAKRLGRQAKMRDDWDSVKNGIMYALLGIKFSKQNVALRRALADTGTRELIEGNTWGDRYWGVHRGIGSNHLGRLLMLVRGAIKAEGQREA